MIQFSEDYNAQTIFDQVWEAPESWWGIHSKVLPAFVTENKEDPDGEYEKKYEVTAEQIEDAVFKVFKEIVSKMTGRDATNFADWVSDLDAEDVDVILQMAVFGEIRYS